MEKKLTLLVLLLSWVITNCFSQSCNEGGDQSIGDNGSKFGWDIFGIGSWDPNQIISPQGFDTARWVSVNDNMGFTIYFENDADFATAPAHNVYVYYPFSDKQNSQTFRLGNFGFNGMVFTVPPNLNVHQTRIDLRDSLGLYVDVTAGIDVVNNKAFWIFQSIDPLTNRPPLNPLSGFLPVKDSTITDEGDTVAVKGEGFVTFSMAPVGTSQTRDTIYSSAKIVFDVNDTISTNTEFNTIDALPPVSFISADLPQGDSVLLHFNAEDDTDGCGVKMYDLYVAQDSSNYITYLTNATDSLITFHGMPGSTYHFFSLATDNVGNREALKNLPDVSVNFNSEIALTVKMFIEGFYEGNNSMRAVIDQSVYPELCDTVILQLAQPVSPYAILFSDTSVIQTSGIVDFNFNDNAIAGNYYLVFRHRNSIETWNSAPFPLELGRNSFNFTIKD